GIGMSPVPFDAIAVRAHAIWQSEGCPNGRDVGHWLRAERELQYEAGGAAAAGGFETSGTSAPGETVATTATFSPTLAEEKRHNGSGTRRTASTRARAAK
ncbi:MAG TPA: DUF2934 domain-containing protein, partial [Opitutaceae bacterium]|nr:DUF2934 domain-containing protein [Opitutaceae bacterium]